MTYPRRAALACSLHARAFYLVAALSLAGAPFAAAFFYPAGVAVLGLAAGLLAAGRAHARRAARYWVGAESERLVAERLRPLEARGWAMRHSIPWRGRGDIDHLVEAPGGPVFAVETKTDRYQPHHLSHAIAAARYLAGRRGRPCVPVICLARRHGVWWADEGVEVVSAELVAARLAQIAAGE
jgi:hypothetical protein